MAVIPTGAIYKSLVFDGEDSRNYGVYITGEAVYNAPERDVEMISIPGRNGSFALDKGRFQNIEVSYPAGIFANTEADFAQGISDFRNFFCSRNGYVRLTDDYNPNEYRMAVYKSGLDVSPAQLKAGEFKIVFDCKPQRYLTSGEEPITIGEWHETETASGSIASFEAKAGDAVKSLLADIEPIQDLHGYDKPWVGGAGKNKLNCLVATIKSKNTGGTWSGNAYTFRGVTYTLNSADGVVVDSIKAVGTASGGNAYLLVGFGNIADSLSLVSGTQYIVSNGASVGTVSYYDGSSSHTGNQSYTFTWDGNSGANFTVGVASGSTVNTVYYPMIRLSSVSDATYEPYSNICPISGYDSVVVSRTGKNLLPTRTSHTVTTNGITAKFNSDGSITLNGTASATAIFNLVSDTASNNRLYLSEGNYILNGDTITNANFWIGAYKNADSGSWAVSSKSSGGAFAIAKGDYIFPRIRVGSGVVLNNETIYPMIRLASETDATFEPYNGNTYTISLNGTRYGGTLDVVSGVLTVTHVAVDLGSLTWEVWPGYTSIFRCGLPSGCKTVGNQGVPNWLCSAYAVTSGVSVSSTIGSIGQLHASYVLANNPSYTDASAFKTAMTGQTLVYELATPTTVQLTAQEVELLVGLNQVWANSGDVEVEYGTAPNVVYNPTLFESSPMLEVEGYGAININDEVVSIQNEELGTIKISGSGGAGPSMPLDTTQLNNGDTIFYNSAPYVVVKVKAISGKLRITRHGAPTNGSCSISNVSTTVTHVIVLPSETTFSKGTNKTVTTSVPLYVSVNDTITSCTLTLTTSYNASTEKVTLNASWTSAPNTIKTTNEYRHNQYYGDSSKSILPSPMYIDLDIGEAYGVIGGEPLSFDNIVTLPAELPKLKSGANTITADNTVTDLKVIPRWWKI